MDTVLRFLQTLWGDDDLPGQIVIWSSDTKKSYWFTELQEAAEAAYKLGKKQNVFVGMGRQMWELAHERKPDGTQANTRGSEFSVTAIPGLWMDIDIAGDGHKESELPASIDDAMGLARSLPLLPTIVVHTGGGIHAHWLFKEPWELEDAESRTVAKQMLTRLQYTIQMAAKDKGWELDSTYDLARVLRPAGTFNHKTGTPREVAIINFHDERRYLPEDFDSILLEVTQQRSVAPRVDPASVLNGIPEGARDVTLFRYACNLRERRMPFEEAEILICQAADNCTPKFPRDQALEKLKSAWKYPEGTERQANKQEAVKKLKDIATWAADQILTHETVGSLATIKEVDEVEYQRIKNSLRKVVSVRDLDGMVKKEVAARKEARLEEVGEAPKTPLEEILKDMPVKGLRKPLNWTVNENGIHMATENGVIRACSVPVILTGKNENIETGEERVAMAFIHDGQWKSLTAEGSVIFGSPAIMKLRDFGLPVASTNARDLIQYLTDFEHENRDILPRQKAISHLGWVNKETFLPGMERDVVLDLNPAMMTRASYYKEQGLLEDWMAMIRPIREYPLGRFVLAAGFASALLQPLEQRAFLLHAWGSSTIGKSACLKATLSIWGDANQTMTNFSSTPVALERMASLRHSLPLGIDERQVAGNRQDQVNQLMYMLGGGKSKDRGTKLGDLTEAGSWRCIVLTNGEQPLTDDRSAAGLKTRSIEINGEFVPNKDLADTFHTKTSTYYGTAGPAFIKALIQKEKDEPKWVQSRFEDLYHRLVDAFPDVPTVAAGSIATVCMGDFLSSIFVWGVDEDVAWDEAVQIGILVMDQMGTVTEKADCTRSYDFFCAWVGSNMSHFIDDSITGTRYGYLVPEDRQVYVYPHILRNALEEEGLNYKKVLRDWAESDLLFPTYIDGRIRKETRQVRIPGNSGRGSFYVVKYTDLGLDPDDIDAPTENW